jgi:hypothetical protein
MLIAHTTTIDRRAAYLANCALALEHVARCLLAEDRCHFFEGEGDYDEGVDVSSSSSSSSSSRRNHF